MALDYDPGRFYIGSTNKKGFHGAVRVAVPPDVAREIAAIVQGGNFPYRTANDFIRDAAMHNLGRLDQLGHATWTDSMQLHVLLLDLEELQQKKEDTDKLYRSLLAGTFLSSPDVLDTARKAIQYVDDDRKADFQRIIDYHEGRIGPTSDTL